MKRILLLLAAIAVLGSLGCAQTGGTVASYEVDAIKVAQVERNAKLNNIQVIWLNYPQRAVRSPVSP